MFGAIVMANKVSFPRCFKRAFTAITCDPIGAKSDERRVYITSCSGARNRRTLSSSETMHRQCIHGFYRGHRCNGRVSDVSVSWRSPGGGNMIHWACQHRPQLDKQILIFTKMLSYGHHRCSVLVPVEIVICLVVINLIEK